MLNSHTFTQKIERSIVLLKLLNDNTSFENSVKLLLQLTIEQLSQSLDEIQKFSETSSDGILPNFINTESSVHREIQKEKFRKQAAKDFQFWRKFEINRQSQEGNRLKDLDGGMDTQILALDSIQTEVQSDE